MPATLHRLSFEKPIYELEEQIAAMESTRDSGAQQQDELRRLRRELSDLKKRVFCGLDAWQTVEVARHPDRPLTSDYVSLVFDEFVELHGDKNLATIWPSAPAANRSIQGSAGRPAERQNTERAYCLPFRWRAP
jgi:acetyl-CoA carboxylase alpha subunit